MDRFELSPLIRDYLAELVHSNIEVEAQKLCGITLGLTYLRIDRGFIYQLSYLDSYSSSVRQFGKHVGWILLAKIPFSNFCPVIVLESIEYLREQATLLTRFFVKVPEVCMPPLQRIVCP